MKRSEIYLRAAELVDATMYPRFSCCAIDTAQGIFRSEAPREFYADLFDLDSPPNAPSTNNENALWKAAEDDMKSWRILMLCLASAISASEGN